MICAGGLGRTGRHRRRIHAAVCVCASAPCLLTASDSCAAGDARAGGGPSCRVLTPWCPMSGGGGDDCRGRGRGRPSTTDGSFSAAASYPGPLSPPCVSAPRYGCPSD
ncbi:uncharacterized protein BDW47DRAFT_107331 [Aspergillus candidus]|uniref:Secreted protein n=1 Tax=Aspergillus candidus TaxID=41067 RepID=A0A2I2F9N9_ASPCN|nr:hypothetical protein BDW47DRAFT_107331 [Aspergillus candidus]PLB37343.1 hypothetical protein BDW47DRAFT_107331 [Aspergillus candidus]